MPNPYESHVLSVWSTITSVVPTRDMPVLVEQFRDTPFFVSMATSFIILQGHGLLHRGGLTTASLAFLEATFPSWYCVSFSRTESARRFIQRSFGRLL